MNWKDRILAFLIIWLNMNWKDRILAFLTIWLIFMSLILLQKI